MAKRIYKYDIPKPTEGEPPAVKVKMPGGAEIVSVKHVWGKARIFALIDPEADEVERDFYLAPTGEDIPVHALPNTGSNIYHGMYTANGKTFHVIETTGEPAP